MFPRVTLVAVLFVGSQGLHVFADEKAKGERPRYAGPTENGFLLPNGWTLTPAGKHVTIADLPLNIMALADNRHALVATKQTRGLGKSPAQVRVADLLAARLMRAADQPGVAEKVAHVGETVDVVDLIEQHQR